MLQQHPCRLIGGEFDGDEGTFPPPLPDVLYVYWCPGGAAASCIENGIHWRKSPPPRRAARYRRDSHHGGVQLYRYADLASNDVLHVVSGEVETVVAA